MPQKVAAAEAAKEDRTVVVVNVKVTVAASVRAMAAATEEVLAAVADVKAQVLVADSGISLVNHVKAETPVEAEDAKAAEAETEDADLNTHKS